MTTDQAFLNGKWIPRGELHLAVDDVGFLLGATVTERLRTFRRQVFRPAEHLARLRNSLEIVGLDAEPIAVQVAGAVGEFADRHRGRIGDDDDWSINAFVTPGLAGAGQPTLCVYGFPLAFDEWAEKYDRGLAVRVSDVQQVPSRCWPSELKCRSRMHYYLADHRAAAVEAGARAILLDEEGYVAEATTANVLLHREGEGLVTPTAEHILYGVSMGVVEELAGRLGLPLVRRRVTVDDLHAADEMMLASTSVCLLPVVSCDGRPVGSGLPDGVYRRLLSAWGELVGVDIADQARRCAVRRRAQ